MYLVRRSSSFKKYNQMLQSNQLLTGNIQLLTVQYFNICAQFLLAQVKTLTKTSKIQVINQIYARTFRAYKHTMDCMRLANKRQCLHTLQKIISFTHVIYSRMNWIRALTEEEQNILQNEMQWVNTQIKILTLAQNKKTQSFVERATKAVRSVSKSLKKTFSGQQTSNSKNLNKSKGSDNKSPSKEKSNECNLVTGLIINIIEPYIKFLQKMLTEPEFYFQLKNQSEERDILKGEKEDELIWKLINSLKEVGAIFEKMNFFIRSYEDNALGHIILFCFTASIDVKTMYTFLANLLSKKIDTLRKSMPGRSLSDNSYRDRLRDIQTSNDFMQLRQQVEEVGVINESLLYLYLNKYLRKYQGYFSTISFINLNDMQYDFILKPQPLPPSPSLSQQSIRNSASRKPSLRKPHFNRAIKKEEVFLSSQNSSTETDKKHENPKILHQFGERAHNQIETSETKTNRTNNRKMDGSNSMQGRGRTNNFIGQREVDLGSNNKKQKIFGGLKNRIMGN